MKYRFNFLFILSITMISAMGGLLFGYDWVVIGGAKPFYEVFFGLTDTPATQGWVMSSALIGCLVGALFSGILSDRFGKKKLLIVAAALFTISALGTGSSNLVSMSIATFSLWSASFILTYSFPILNKGLGASGTFWLFGSVCLFGFFFTRKTLPETRGKSLEEIERALNG